MDEDRYTRITLRIPKTVYSALTEAAESNSHSMNAEIIHRLSKSFEDPARDEIEWKVKEHLKRNTETAKEFDAYAKQALNLDGLAEDIQGLRREMQTHQEWIESLLARGAQVTLSPDGHIQKIRQTIDMRKRKPTGGKL